MSRKPRRRKKGPAARLRPFWLLCGVLAIGAALGLYYAATWPGFYPKRVSVSGNRVVPADQIVSRAQIAPRENVWLQNVSVSASRIAAIPYIETATVRRSLPAAVHITVTERTPFVRLRYGTQTVLADRHLRVLQSGGGNAALPVLVTGYPAAPPPGAFVKNQNAVQLRDDYEALADAHVMAALLQYDKFGDLVATMHNGVQLLLGDDRSLAQTAPLVGPILSQVAAQGRQIAQVDLRAPKTPVVVFKK